jgi:uronate dehydrogenase
MVGLTADYRFEIVYGLSRSTRTSFDNSNAYRLGYQPLDNADDYERTVEESPPRSGAAAAFQGSFVSTLFSGHIDWPP